MLKKSSSTNKIIGFIKILLCPLFFIPLCESKPITDNSILSGEYDFGMRTRYQRVNDNWLGNATASTTRLRFSSKFMLDDDEKLQLHIEPNYVFAFNKGDYNSVTIQSPTPPIPDPTGLSWSNINLNYVSDGRWQATLGRQTITYDNERMVGAQEFWQTPQGFDAITFDYNDQINWHLQYAYTNKVHRIFGKDARTNLNQADHRYSVGKKRPTNELGEHALNAHLFNAEYKTENNLLLNTYVYLLNNKDHASSSSNTLGGRISDEFKPKKLKYRYAFELASQRGAYNNLVGYHSWYNLLEASVQYKSHIIQLSQETFSENNNQGFQTSLGTLHKFQGWSDASSGYSSMAGLRDQYFTYRGRHKKLRWRAVFHRFLSVDDSHNIGNEFDLELAYRATRHWEFKLVYADYRAKKGTENLSRLNFNVSTWFASISYNI